MWNFQMVVDSHSKVIHSHAFAFQFGLKASNLSNSLTMCTPKPSIANNLDKYTKKIL
jgi:hypothetical protein